MNKFSDYFGDYIDSEWLSHLADGEITSLTISRNKRELTVGLHLPSLLSYEDSVYCSRSIQEKMGLDKVNLDVRYDSSLFDVSFLPSIISKVKNNNAAVNGFFKDAEPSLEGSVLKIGLKYGGADVLTAKSAGEMISAEIQKLFGIDLSVEFCELQNYDIEKAVKQAVEQKKQQEEQKKAEEEKNVEHRLLGDFPIYEDTVHLIYGKTIREKPKKMEDINTDDGIITVWGDVLNSEADRKSVV